MIPLIISAAVVCLLLVAVLLLLTNNLNRSEQNIRAAFDARLEQTRLSLDGRFDSVRETLDRRLEDLARMNDEKLELMRRTVDEKLQSTLEKRLGESFKLVGDNLERVIKSLGEMQAVASNVDDLKRVLSNVKTRGTWGETQLESLLEEILQADQYGKNIKPNPRGNREVEFAVKMPGRDEEGAYAPLWLPIDAKFPLESYDRLCLASERSDAKGVEQAGGELEAAVLKSARDIRDKYISPPHTTDFAILFLPTEGLYAELMRRPGFADKVRRDCKVVITGPSTLAAILSSLRMGFQTLVVQKKSAEIGKTLRDIKKQFGLFGDLLEKVQKKLEEAGKTVGEASERHRIMSGKLSKVEELPAGDDTSDD